MAIENENITVEDGDTDPLHQIAKEIAQLRMEQGITQKDLAHMIGTKQSAISRFEKGAYNPSVYFLHKLATAVGKELQIRIK